MTNTIIVIPIMGQFPETKSFWGSLLNTVKGPVDLMVIDNAASIDEGQVGFFEKFIRPFWPGQLLYMPQNDNLGVVKSLQFAYEAIERDLYIFMHNDLFIYQIEWNRRLEYLALDNRRRSGLVGVFGAEGVSQGGGRYQVWSNMLEAEIHGYRDEGIHHVCVLDGMMLGATRKMLDVRGGVDIEFDTHHFYDLDLSLESIDRGFCNYILGVPVHHVSGVTANRPLFNEWADRHVGEHIVSHEMKGQDWLYQKNLSRFRQKWDKHLPWRVGEPWKR